MQPNIEISIEKLSAPVEALPIHPRVYRPLRRASIYTVAEVILVGRRRLTSMRGIGESTADRLLEAAARYLGVSEDTFTRQNALFAAGEAPITLLALPLSILHDLESLGLFHVRDLLKSRPNHYSNILGMQEEELDRIDQSLRMYLAGVAGGQIENPSETWTATFSPTQPDPQDIDLGLHLQNLKIDQRAWDVLKLRSQWVGALGKISKAVGLSGPHSVANIIRRAHEDLHGHLSSLSTCLDAFEARAALLAEHRGDTPLEQDALVRYLLPNYTGSGLTDREEDLQRLIVLVRTLVLHRRAWFAQESKGKWKAFTELCCRLEPQIQNRASRRRTAEKMLESVPDRIIRKEWIHQVLERAGKPMRVSEIAVHVRELSGERAISATSIRNCLNGHKKLFVHVEQSTYGLREWRDREIEVYNVIIAALLKDAKTAMPLDWIFERVSAVQPVNWGSLRRSLMLHPCFYRSICRTYGLRGWLPEGDTATRPVPDWLVEDPISARRVRRSLAQGDHVERLVGDDRWP